MALKECLYISDGGLLSDFLSHWLCYHHVCNQHKAGCCKTFVVDPFKKFLRDQEIQTS